MTEHALSSPDGQDPSQKRRRKPERQVAILVLAPFRLVAQILLLDVKLKRKGRRLHVLINARRPTVKRDTRVDKTVAEAAPLRRALKELIDMHPLTRHLMRHLGYLERALATQGLQALTEVPIEVLTVALTQLDSIVSNWSNHHLADLRSRMAVALKDRLRASLNAGLDEQRSDFATASRLLVGDVAHSVFEELERQYRGLVPQETIQAALEAVRRVPNDPNRPEVHGVQPA